MSTVDQRIFDCPLPTSEDLAGRGYFRWNPWARSYEPVQGEAVQVAGFEDLDLFTYVAFGDKFVVAEGKFGQIVGDYFPDRADAVQCAAQRLRFKGLETAVDEIEKRAVLIGRVSPRWTGIREGSE